MKKLLIPTFLFGSLLATQAQFTAGDLVVLQDGNGSAALTSAGTAIFLDQYTTLGTFVNSLAIPSTGPTALVNSGTATSEGALNLSANGQYLVLAGYNTNAGGASIASTTSATTPRGVATVDASGNYTLAATTSSSFNANNIRSGTSDGNGNFWAVGANSGTVYFNSGSTTITNQSAQANNRVLQDIGGNLYFSSGSGTHGIYSIAGTPTTTGATANNLINTGAASSPYDFAFNAAGNVLYIADSSIFTNSTTVGGVEKWSFNGSAWVFDYSLAFGTNGAVGLAVDFSGANPVIYGTTANGQSLFDIVDNGAGSTGNLLASAGANEAFRGLDWTPGTVPEPSTLALGGLGLAAIAFFRRNRKV